MAEGVSGYEPVTYWSERAKANGPLYVAKGNAQEHYDREYQEFAPRLVSLVPFCDRLLDFGCGSGRFAGLLATKCKEYIGADVAPDGIALARERHPHLFFDVVVADIPYLQLDAIVGVFVMQHMVAPEDFQRWCDEFRFNLRHGGSLVVIDRDPWPDGPPLAHMLPRGPEAIAEATGMRLDRLERANADHWAGRFVK